MNGSGVEVLLPTTYSAPWDSIVTGVPLAPVVGVFCPVGESACRTVTESWYQEVVGTIGRTTSEVSVRAVVTGVSWVFPFLFSYPCVSLSPLLSLPCLLGFETLEYMLMAVVVLQNSRQRPSSRPLCRHRFLPA